MKISTSSGAANFASDLFRRGPLTISSIPKSVEEEPNSGNSTELKRSATNEEKELSQLCCPLKNKTHENKSGNNSTSFNRSRLCPPTIQVQKLPQALGLPMRRGDFATASDQGLENKRDSLLLLVTQE